MSATLPAGETWISFDSTQSAPKISLDLANTGVVDEQSFSITFQVTDNMGNSVVSETFSVTIINCSSLTTSGLAFDAAGAATFETTQADAFVWNLSF